jgi:hypothetical protein
MYVSPAKVLVLPECGCRSPLVKSSAMELLLVSHGWTKTATSLSAVGWWVSQSQMPILLPITLVLLVQVLQDEDTKIDTNNPICTILLGEIPTMLIWPEWRRWEKGWWKHVRLLRNVRKIPQSPQAKPSSRGVCLSNGSSVPWEAWPHYKLSNEFWKNESEFWELRGAPVDNQQINEGQ